MLNKHQDIHITNEARAFFRDTIDREGAEKYFNRIQHYVNRRDHAYRRFPEGFDSHNIKELCMKKLKSDDLDGKTQAFCDAINVNNWKFTGDKGADPSVLVEMAEQGLEFKLIWIHRDGRDAAHSGVINGKPGAGPPWSSDYRVNAKGWTGRVLGFLDNIDKFSNVDYTILRFEDYADEPGLNGKKINHFLGVTNMEYIEKSMIDPDRIKQGYGIKAHPDWRQHFSENGKRALKMLGYI